MKRVIKYTSFSVSAGTVAPVILTLAEGRDVLDPHREAVLMAPAIKAVETWQSFVAKAPALASPLDETARAAVIHCWWRTEVRRALVDAKGIREVAALGFFAVAVAQNPLVRFKFLGNGTPSNVATEQQRDLAFHRYDDGALTALGLEGIPAPPTILTVGYSLNAAAELRSIEVRCDYGKRLLWRWPIWGEEAVYGGVVEPMTLPGVSGPVPARVRSRTKPRDEAEEGGQEAP